MVAALLAQTSADDDDETGVGRTRSRAGVVLEQSMSATFANVPKEKWKTLDLPNG